MKNSTFSRFSIDNASILFLAQFRKDHTNTFRFTMTLTEPICPATLQRAVNHVYRRFPSIFARFRPGFFAYSQIPLSAPPQVMPDPGCLITMTKEELHHCPYRICYAENTVSIEAFHALTDGYGAIASFTTMMAEYLRLHNQAEIPVTGPLADLSKEATAAETEDSFLTHQGSHASRVPRRYAYQLPGGKEKRTSIQTTSCRIPTDQLLDAAHRYGISANTLISSIMAVSVMEVQKAESSASLLPVRIMVPVNLRRLFPSRTLRNFSYYALATMESDDTEKSMSELFRSFDAQIRTQLQQETMRSVITNNAKMQSAWYFRVIPFAIKRRLVRLICHFFGERTSSITVTNLGNVVLPEEMRHFVTHMDVTLTPRMNSPYGCTVLSYGDTMTVNLSRFPQHSVLDEIFLRNLHTVLQSKEQL